ncbi:CDP-alcohol phosphatidyltransferase family protein [Coralliovum pocilloporae]|uniref:CDP-alcohol phosphatidyltransferase family protein n=1 Tax=Coralliovum pocilloporae TaxID=3066369 RepID=UPI003307997B
MADTDQTEPKLARRRFRKIPLRVMAPNLVTLLSICAGLTGVRFAIEGRFEAAVIAILVAAVLDGLDGRVARLLKSASRFGAELDSLADFFNFGAAPAIVLYAWGLGETGSFGWIACLIYAIGMALRLARFNAALDDPKKPEWQAGFFTGVPAPAGALIVFLPIYFTILGMERWPGLESLVAVYTMIVGLLLVSQLPTFSTKRVSGRIPREHVLPFLVLTVAAIALLMSYPWTVLTMISMGYLLTLPVSFFFWKKYEREHAEELALVDEDDGLGDGEDDSDGESERDAAPVETPSVTKPDQTIVH